MVGGALHESIKTPAQTGPNTHNLHFLSESLKHLARRTAGLKFQLFAKKNNNNKKHIRIA